jgi:hypothetical protein
MQADDETTQSQQWEAKVAAWDAEWKADMTELERRMDRYEKYMLSNLLSGAWVRLKNIFSFKKANK